MTNNPSREPFRTVITNDDDWDAARKIDALFGDQIWGFVDSGLGPRETARMVRSVSCRTCGAHPDDPCTTATGNQTSNHKDRKLGILAATFAKDREIVIMEEDHIDDLL